MSNNKPSSELNEQQYKAVNCSLGNKLILAGAGRGKTKVLIHRVAVLIKDFIFLFSKKLLIFLHPLKWLL